MAMNIDGSMHRGQGDGIQRHRRSKCRHAVVIQQPRDWQSDTAVEVGRVGISRIRGLVPTYLTGELG